MNLNEIEPFPRLWFVLSHENNNQRFNDGRYYCISELGDRTNSSLSQNTEKMLTLSIFEH